MKYLNVDLKNFVVYGKHDKVQYYQLVHAHASCKNENKYM